MAQGLGCGISAFWFRVQRDRNRVYGLWFLVHGLGRGLLKGSGIEVTCVRIREQLLHKNVQRFRGGLVVKAHRLCVSLNSRLDSNNEEREEQGIGCRVWGTSSIAPGKSPLSSSNTVCCSCIRVPRFRVQGSGFRVQGSRVQGSGFTVHGLGCGVLGGRFWVWI